MTPVPRPYRQPRALVALLALVLGATTAALGLGSPSTASASAPPAAVADPPKPLKVVLLGDSYSAGNGARTSSDDRAYFGPEPCHRSKANWAQKYVDGLTADGYNVTFSNRACSDGVTSNMVSPRNMGDSTGILSVVVGSDAAAQAALDSNRPCDTDSYPDEESWTYDVIAWDARGITYKCTRYLRAQTDFVGPETDLVLFTMGGNDIKFSDIVKQCFVTGLRSPGDCRDKVEDARDRLADVRTGVLAAIDQMRENGLREDARIVYLGYPLLALDNGYDLTSWFGLGRDHYAVADEVRALGLEGDAAQDDIVAEANVGHPGQVIHLEGVPQKFEGHEPDGRATSRNPDRWLFEFETKDQREWYHPNGLGHTAYAELLGEGGTYGAGGTGGTSADLDIVFAIDTTGSMADDIDAARATANALVNDVQSRTTSARFAVVDYKDQPEWSGDPYAAQVDQDFTTSASAIESALGGLVASGGGDTPEAMYSGIEAGLGLDWRAGVKKAVIVLADAPPHDPEPVSGLTAAQVIADSYAVDPAAVYVVDTGGATDANLQKVADDTGGLVIRTDSTSDVAGALAEAIDTAIANPYAWINGPYTERIGAAVELDASGSYAVDGTLESYEWDFDADGVTDETTTTPYVTHTWSAAYDGLVALTVTDSGDRIGLATTHVSVTPDGDEVPQDVDNCPAVANPGQEDYDGDGIGDDCDPTVGLPEEDQRGVYEGNLLTDPANPGNPPVTGGGTVSGPTGSPRVLGKAWAGRKVRIEKGAWPAGSVLAVQWLRDKKPIKGATGDSYRLTRADIGHKVSARVSAALPGGGFSTSRTIQSLVGKFKPRVRAEVRSADGQPVVLKLSAKAPGIGALRGVFVVRSGDRRLAVVELEPGDRGTRLVRLGSLGAGKHVLRVRFASAAGVVRSGHAPAVTIG